jgi:hypothetical protein
MLTCQAKNKAYPNRSLQASMVGLADALDNHTTDWLSSHQTFV